MTPADKPTPAEARAAPPLPAYVEEAIREVAAANYYIGQPTTLDARVRDRAARAAEADDALRSSLSRWHDEVHDALLSRLATAEGERDAAVAKAVRIVCSRYTDGDDMDYEPTLKVVRVALGDKP